MTRPNTVALQRQGAAPFRQPFDIVLRKIPGAPAPFRHQYTRASVSSGFFRVLSPKSLRQEANRLLPASGTNGELIFDHVKFGVSDYAASKAFFLKALEPLGVVVCAEGTPTYGVELCPTGGNVSLCLCQSDEKPAHLHLAFMAENRRQVDAFYRAALDAGGKDNGAPGLRAHYHANYYAAFVIGPDGHNIEVVCHEPKA